MSVSTERIGRVKGGSFFGSRAIAVLAAVVTPQDDLVSIRLANSDQVASSGTSKMSMPRWRQSSCSIGGSIHHDGCPVRRRVIENLWTRLSQP